MIRFTGTELGQYIWAFDFLPAIDSVTDKDIYLEIDVSRRSTHPCIKPC